MFLHANKRYESWVVNTLGASIHTHTPDSLLTQPLCQKTLKLLKKTQILLKTLT
jgi:hypothetical protein